jgi:methionine-rich copper-binding protein CopC
MSGRVVRGAAVLMIAGSTILAPGLASAARIGMDPPDGSTQTRVPDRVTLTFGQPQAPSSTIEVIDPCGERADAGSTSVDGRRVSVEIDATASGRYSVEYAGIAAADGNPVNARFGFRVAGVEGCSAGDRPAAGRAGRGIWDLPKTDFAVALGIAALIGALGGLVYAAILGPKA